MRNFSSRWLFAAAAVAAITAACSSDPVRQLDDAAPADTSMAGPDDLVSTMVGAAAAGDDLVVQTVELKSGERHAVVRHADGSWSELPDPPVLGPITSVGSTVAIGGVSCDGEPCRAGVGRLAVAMLNEEMTEWLPLEVSAVSLPSDVEISTVAGPLEHAVFSIGSENYVVAPDRAVQPLPAPRQGGTYCFTDDYAVSVPLAQTELGAESQFTLAGEVEMLEMSDPSTGWSSVGPVPEGVPATFDSGECAGGRFAFHWGDAQHVLAIPTWEWSTQRSTWQNLHQTRSFEDAPGDVAVAPGGAAVFAVRGNGLSRRDGDGSWTATGLTSDGVYATDAAVLSLDPESGTFVPVWERGE